MQENVQLCDSLVREAVEGTGLDDVSSKQLPALLPMCYGELAAPAMQLLGSLLQQFSDDPESACHPKWTFEIGRLWSFTSTLRFYMLIPHQVVILHYQGSNWCLVCQRMYSSDSFRAAAFVPELAARRPSEESPSPRHKAGASSTGT